MIRSEYPKLEWVHNYAVLGMYDDPDMFTAPDSETAMKIAIIIFSSLRCSFQIHSWSCLYLKWTSQVQTGRYSVQGALLIRLEMSFFLFFLGMFA